MVAYIAKQIINLTGDCHSFIVLGVQQLCCHYPFATHHLTLIQLPYEALQVIAYICTELQFIKNLTLGKTGLEVLVAKHPIFYLASLFCYIPL